MREPSGVYAKRCEYLFLAMPLIAALVLLLACSTVDRKVREVRLPCGVYRWPVKTLTDADAKLVRWRPINTTLRDLVELPRPSTVEESHRTAHELEVYHIEALLIRVRPTLDHDLHLLLRDPVDPDIRMLGEIPDPVCAKGSGHEAAFAAARKVAESIQANQGETLVEVTGVGFFDTLHDIEAPSTRNEHAPNGFELHPVLLLREVRAKGH